MTCPLPQDHIPKYDLLFSAWLVCLKEWCVCYTKRWKAVSVCVETETSKSLQIRNVRADLFTALFRRRVVATIRSHTLFGRSNSVNGERIALYHGLDGSLSWTVPPSSPTVRKREESPLSHTFSVMEYVHPRKLDLKRFESTSDCERRLFLRRDCFCVKLSVENAICDSHDALLCCVILSKQASSDSSSMISLPIKQCVPSCALGASAWKDRSSFFLHCPSSVHPLHLHSFL